MNHMSRIFAYTRVSTIDQDTANQLLEIQSAGYTIEPHRYIEEHISGSVEAFKRPCFLQLTQKLEQGDTLVVTKLDRLGRDSINVQQTVHWFTEQGIRLIVLQLGNLDLTSSSGALMIKVLSAVADFERQLIIERVQSGLARAKANNVRLGRPPKTSQNDQQEIVSKLAHGVTVSQLARDYGISRASVIKIRESTRS
jgi:putative DNA-invertase from lambdoid prophage Rac